MTEGNSRVVEHVLGLPHRILKVVKLMVGLYHESLGMVVLKVDSSP